MTSFVFVVNNGARQGDRLFRCSNKPNPNQIKMVNGDGVGKACEGCFCKRVVAYAFLFFEIKN